MNMRDKSRSDVTFDFESKNDKEFLFYYSIFYVMPA